MLKAISMQRAIFTLLYRGYDIEVSRAPSGWRVGVYPRTRRPSYPALWRGLRLRSRRSSDRGQTTCGWCSSLACSAQFRW